MITFTLGWPDAKLSPNARSHFMVKAKAIKTARKQAFLYCLIAIDNRHHGEVVPEAPQVEYTFHPIDKRRRDIDNCIAMTKAYSDGIADALKVNDNTFRLSYFMGEVRKPACVEVVIT